MKAAFKRCQRLRTGLALTFAFTLAVLGLTSVGAASAAVGTLEIRANTIVGNPGDAPGHFAMQANLELSVLADGTLAVRHVRGNATFTAPSGPDYTVWRDNFGWKVESATVSGFVARTDDDGEVVLVLEELTFGLARLQQATPRASDADRATVVVVVGPPEPPPSSNGWWVTKPHVTLTAGDSTATSEGTLRYRLFATPERADL